LQRYSAFRSITALILREMASSEGRVLGGYLWAVIEPVAAITLLTLVFSAAFHSPPLGNDFAVFYASGYLPFALYSDLAQKAGVSLRFSRPLLAYPAASWMDAILARIILCVLTHAVVVFLVLGGLVLRSPDHLSISPAPIVAGFGLVALWGASLGVLNAYLFGAFPIWERLWAILGRPLFLLSGIVFLPDSLPAPYAGWLALNPILHGVGLVRSGLYAGYSVDYAQTLPFVLSALLPIAIGLGFLTCHAPKLLQEG
jgi:capsular polysaccharide transport system permease protein